MINYRLNFIDAPNVAYGKDPPDSTPIVAFPAPVDDSGSIPYGVA